jgi:aldose 1-epimerase
MILRQALLSLLIPVMSTAADYSAERAVVDGIEVIRLKDAARKTEVSIVPSLGHNAYQMKVNGKDVFWSPYQTLKEFQQKPTQLGNPFLAPWANRIDGDAYWANGKKYNLNPELKNFHYDAFHQPIHGLVTNSKDWRVVSLKADANSASVTSRLEYWRHPDWMAQFPFAHTIEMTYSLREGVLEVSTAIENLSLEPMPLSLGYHTYYRIDDSPRDAWRVHVAAREQVVLSKTLVPTGERRPVTLQDPQPLAGIQLDHVFTSLVRDDDGRAEFRVEGQTQKISILYGRKFDVAVVYAPPGREFICFEPMAGVTNAFNLAQAGVFKGLQSVAPGETWRESFWIKPAGY